MNELSLYILDIVQNSFNALAKEVEIIINEDPKHNIFSIEIKDDGIGIDELELSQVTDPFYTTRKTRNVGLGIPLFVELCRLCEGEFTIQSNKSNGTYIKGQMKYDSINRLPMGDIVETLYVLIINNNNIDIIYKHYFNNQKFYINTKDIKKILCNISIHDYHVSAWIKEYISENLITLEKEIV